MPLSKLLATFFPPQPYASLTEKLLSAVGALVAILALAWVTSRFLSPGPTLFMVASMGASAVLLFATSHSPLAQPWALVGGHMLSALIGVACQQFIPDTAVATAAAVALSILAMHLLHCLHPPGGATALMPVLGGPEVQQLGYGFVVAPVAINAVVLLVLALIINNLLPGRRYPTFAHPPPKGREPHDLAGWPLGKFSIAQADLESALKEMHTYIDVSEDDLEQIYTKAMLHSHQRRMGEIRVRDIMERDAVAAEYGDELEQIWDRMREHRVKGVPIVDRARRVIGMVTIMDFLKLVGPCADEHLFRRLCRLIRRTPGVEADKAEVVGQIMTSPVITAREDAHIVSLIPLFSEHDIHHVPVVDAQEKLVGMVTQSDLMEALYKLRIQLG